MTATNRPQTSEEKFTSMNQIMKNIARTKIVATVGPASWDLENLKELVKRGVDVFRINTAHGDRSVHQRILDTIRTAEAELHQPVSVLVDLAGPKIRLNHLEGDPIQLSAGQRIQFEESPENLSSNVLRCKFPGIIPNLKPDDSILLADGLIKLTVTETVNGAATCYVNNGGTLRGKQGINIPGANINVSALSDTDKDNAAWAASQKVDFVSLSFVRTPKEIQELKEIVSRDGNPCQVLSKIEKPEALSNLEEIVTQSDAVMVARGDLGVEIDIEKTPAAQKKIVRTCHRLGRPVIVATQMLESMHSQPRPTRAEVSDVANAILDGADACMLSGETAVGDFSFQAVEVMNRIMLETESQFEALSPRDLLPLSDDVSLSMARGAARIAEEVDAKSIVMISDRTEFAKSLSRMRAAIPTFAFTSNKEIAGCLNLSWGIIPKIVDQETLSNLEKFQAYLSKTAKESWNLKEGDRIVLVNDGHPEKQKETWMTVVIL